MEEEMEGGKRWYLIPCFRSRDGTLDANIGGAYTGKGGGEVMEMAFAHFHAGVQCWLMASRDFGSPDLDLWNAYSTEGSPLALPFCSVWDCFGRLAHACRLAWLPVEPFDDNTIIDLREKDCG